MTDKDLATTLITASLAAFGWLSVYILNSLREDRTKRLQSIIEHSAEQIKDFYAPLISLTDQLNSLANIRDRTIRNNIEKVDLIDRIFYDNYFTPLHDVIKIILSTKVHLIEGEDLPVSFKEYFEHVAGERAYRKMIDEKFDTREFTPPPFPSQFYWDVRLGFKDVSKRHEDSLREIRIPWLGFPVIGFPRRLMATKDSLPEKRATSI